ncbi:radical SAM/SPASM family putative metalloenzyme maturase [Oleidesulfovibrio sp.]|uniref:radical SAM/SPASM family putative metalloenzyme maturase n=1 Tax=Oleidesulfovibrio sp. TaxID=2909707 RepID=UPI003A8AA1D9
MSEYPRKLYVEVTTRCNLRCAMCVKQAEGCCIEETDMEMSVFDSLLPALEYADALVLNGIGEPLLHAGIADMVRKAKAMMPASAKVGFQSNGLLLTSALAEELLSSGLDTICFSVDSLASAALEVLHGGGHTQTLVETLRHCRAAADRCGRSQNSENPFEIGIEFVLMRDNARELPQVVRWSAQQGAAYCIVTHVLPYDAATQRQSLFVADTKEALEFFSEWKQKAADSGLDLAGYYALFRKFSRTPEEQRLVDFVADMQLAASEAGISLHLERLIENHLQDDASLQLRSDTEVVFAAAEEEARREGIRLVLPTLQALLHRQCEFVDEDGVFVTADGGVHPCYFLWHRYACHLDGQKKQIYPRTFGNLAEQSMYTIWNSTAYKQFRDDVLRYEYPDCSNCTLVPCDDITGELGEFEMDCHGETVPCGHCPWCLGGVQCLRL